MRPAGVDPPGPPPMGPSEGKAAQAEGPDDLRRPAPAGAARVTRVAWGAVVVVSLVPAVVAMELTGSVPDWLTAAQVAFVLVLAVAGSAWPVVRPLRPFALAMAAFLVLPELVSRLDLTWMPAQALFGSTAFDDRMQAEQAGKLLVTLGMIAVLLLLGFRRRAFFLARGDLRAPIRPVRFLGFPHPDPWWRFGLQWGLYIAAALAVALYLSQRPTAEELAAVVPMLPSVLFFAALNAFNEEMTYRAPMIATLEPVVGSTQAMLQAAFLFGVAHYFGTPGGLTGAALAVFMGWILGKAMVETRGLFWSWWIHFLSDVVIFVFLAAGLVA